MSSVLDVHGMKLEKEHNAPDVAKKWCVSVCQFWQVTLSLLQGPFSCQALQPDIQVKLWSEAITHWSQLLWVVLVKYQIGPPVAHTVLRKVMVSVWKGLFLLVVLLLLVYLANIAEVWKLESSVVLKRAKTLKCSPSDDWTSHEWT